MAEAKAIRETVERITRTNPALNALLEEDVKQGVVLPLLGAAGWDRDNPQEVRPAPIGHNVVDYRLRLNSSDLVFIEAKSGSEDLNSSIHQNQLMNYCSKDKDVKLAVLTNGREWRFYLPVKESRSKESWQIEGRFCTIEFDKPKEVAELLERFLSRDRVESGSAIITAKRYRGNKENDEIRKSAIITAWNQVVVATPDETLLELVRTATAGILSTDQKAKSRKINHLVKTKLVKDVISEHADRLRISSESSPKQSPDANPTDLVGWQPRVIRFLGNSHKANKWTKVLDTLCVVIHANHSDHEFLQVMLSSQLQGRNNKAYFATAKSDLTRARPIGLTGLYRARDVPQIHKKIQDILHKFDYPEESLEIDVTHKDDSKSFTLLWPQSIRR